MKIKLYKTKTMRRSILISIFCLLAVSSSIAQIMIANATLADLEVPAQVLYVFNKVDKIGGKEQMPTKALTYTPHVPVNTVEKDGCEDLRNYLVEHRFTRKEKK